MLPLCQSCTAAALLSPLSAWHKQKQQWCHVLPDDDDDGAESGEDNEADFDRL